MKSSPATRASLLIRVRSVADEAAWREFVQLYAPLIHAYALRRGLQYADAAEIVQQTLTCVAQAMPHFDYDASHGSFRGWLFTVTRNCVYKSLARRPKTPIATGETAFQRELAQIEAPSDDEHAWNREYQLRLFQHAAFKAKGEFRTRTWNAFWFVAVEGDSPATVAKRLGMSVGGVYIAKSRVTSRIRSLVDAIEAE